MDDIVREALDAFAAAEAHESDNRSAALDDLRFAWLGGEWPWPDKVRRQREAEGRPCLTINKMPAFIRQVVNDSRQNKPSIRVPRPYDPASRRARRYVGHAAAEPIS